MATTAYISLKSGKFLTIPGVEEPVKLKAIKDMQDGSKAAITLEGTHTVTVVPKCDIAFIDFTK